MPTANNKTQSKWWILTACAVICTILVNELPNFHPEKYLGMTYSWQLDMAMHSSYFCVVTLILRFTYFKETHALTFFSLLFIAAVTLELLQTWIPKRSSTLLDVASNCIGILLGLFLIEKIKVIRVIK